MKLINQPPNSKSCGQHCVAMIVGCSVKKIISLIGENPTRTKDLACMLRNTKKFRCKHKLTRFSQFKRQLPHLCILRFRYKDAPKSHSHWVVYNKGVIYDPSWPCIYVFDKYSMANMKARATSFLEIIKK